MLRFVALLFLFLTALKADPGITLASNYQKNSALQWEWATESLKNFAFGPSDQVLDIGSGDGKVTALIATLIPEGKIIGIDISDTMVHHASSLYCRENLQFLQGDATAIPFKAHFDKVVSFCALHWIVDQEQALQSIRDCLKPNGRMLIVIPGKSHHNLGPSAERLAQSEKWAPYFPHFKKTRIYFSKDEYADLLRQYQFEVRSMESKESVTIFSNRAAFVEWLTPLVNFINHLPFELQKTFIADLAHQMLSNMTVLSTGSISMQDIKLEIVAVKL